MAEQSVRRSLDTSNPEHLHYQQGALDIAILGGVRLEGLDRMRVTMKCRQSIYPSATT